MVSVGTSGSKVQPFALIVFSATILQLSPMTSPIYILDILELTLHMQNLVPRSPQCDDPLLDVHTHPVYSAFELTGCLQMSRPVRRAYPT